MRGLIVAVCLGACVAEPQPDPGPNCGPGTVEQNGVCVAVYTPPPGTSLGNGATIYVWASASTANEALGTIYVLVNDGWEGSISGYASGGTPGCGFNDIYAAIIGVAPGQSYRVGAHDERSTGWADLSTPVLTAGHCWSLRLN